MSSCAPAAIAENLLGASYYRAEAGIPAGFAGVFGRIAQRYFDLYGDQSDALAAIAAKEPSQRGG
jgi:acetyl-CoA C-acetyltransferase